MNNFNANFLSHKSFDEQFETSVERKNLVDLKKGVLTRLYELARADKMNSKEFE